jgi:hypothetical protein
MTREPHEHAWSSYRATAGLEPGPEWLVSGWILAQFGSRPGRARARYREFVLEGIRRPSPWSDLRGQVLLGSQAFVDRLEPRLGEHAAAAEVPKRQRLAHRPALCDLFGPGVLSSMERRNAAIRRAFLEHQYTLAEIGRHVGLHYATISRIARQPPE